MVLNAQGHSIECRINAEDPFQNFRPGPGRVIGYLAPGGPHVRMDSHLYPDYLVSPAPPPPPPHPRAGLFLSLSLLADICVLALPSGQLSLPNASRSCSCILCRQATAKGADAER